MNPHINPTHNIWAVGQNYLAHVKEMLPQISLQMPLPQLPHVPTVPMIFLKSGNCLNAQPVIHLPKWSENIHHELEIAFLVDDNLNFSHISLALDLTARDIQEIAKKKGAPWTLAKSFTGSCPVGSWVSILDIKDFKALEFILTKNKFVVQHGRAQDMIFKPETVLAYIKDHFPLAPHDIVITGTPEGVGRLQSGDVLHAELRFEKQVLLACHWDVI